jgi:hypothetical protein
VIYADYYWYFKDVFGKRSRFARESILYAGGGTGAGFWDRTQTCGRWNCSWASNSTGTGNGFFVRAVVGIEWFPPGWNAGVFTEVAPSYMWYPSTGNTVDFAIGARYYF